MSKEFLSPKSDLVFKWLFGDDRHIDLLTGFLTAVLDLPADEYAEVAIVDPTLLPDFAEDKLSILDVKVKTRSGHVINIEIQVAPIEAMRERIIYYLAKMITEQVGRREDYNKLKRVIGIVILDYNLITQNRSYHNQYVLYDRATESKFTDLVELHTLELPKLPPESDRTRLFNWLRFLRAERKEELDMLSQTDPQIKKAVGRLLELSADEQKRMVLEAREKARRDESGRLLYALAKGREEGEAKGIAKGIREGQLLTARKLLAMNLADADIAEATDLSLAEIEALRHS